MRLACIVLLTALTACTAVGPNYQPPAIPAPAGWNEPRMDGVETGWPEDGRWWNYFNDPVLSSLIKRASGANLDLRLAASRLREARTLREIVAADRGPDISASTSYTRSRRSQNAIQILGQGQPSPAGGQTTAGGSGFSNKLELDMYKLGLDATWEIDWFGSIQRSIEAAEADIDAAGESRRAVLVSLTGEVAQNYVQLRSLQRQIAITRQNIQAQRDTLEISRVRFAAGLGSQLDVARAESQVAATESQFPTLESSLKQTVNRLGVLLGQEPGALGAEFAQAAPIPVPPAKILVGLPSDLLRRRPDIRRAERDLAAATARIGVATAELYPSLSLTGSFGLQSIDFDTLAKSASRFWSIGPAIRLPIFNRDRLRANVQVQEAKSEQALIRYEQAQLAALEDVKNALTAYVEEQVRQAALLRAVAADQQAVEMANELYTKGLSDFLNVLDSQRSLYASQSQLAKSQAAVSSYVVALYKALGGGWETGE